MLVASVASSVVVLFSFSHEDVQLYIAGLPIFTISIAVMLFWLASSENTVVHKLLANSVLRWIGNISYSLYLWHYLMYEYAKKEFIPSASQIFIAVALAFGIAAASYHLLEKPFLRLKFQFNSKKAEV
jgi:peptidoglycan/LPS O-acetylase OafA/YrhL